MTKLIFSSTLLSVLIFIFGGRAFAQDYDSALKEFEALSSDTAKISYLINEMNRFTQTHPQEVAVINESLFKTAKDKVPELYRAKLALNTGRTYLRFGNYDLSLKYLEEANKTDFDESENLLLKGEILRNIGNIYFIRYQPEEAMKFYREALQYFERAEDKTSIATLYGGIGNIYYEEFKFDSSLHYNLRALRIREDLGDEMDIGRSYLNTGMLLDAMDSLDAAIEYSEIALEIAERNNARIMMTYPLKVLSSVYRKKGELNDALNYASQSLSLAEDMEIIYEMKDAHANLAAINYDLGNYKAAYEHLSDQKSLNDSLLNEDANQRLAEMRAEYETEKAEQENQILTSQNALQRTRFITATIILVLILGIVIFFYYKSVSDKKKKLQLAKKDRELSDSKRKLAEEKLANEELKSEGLQKELTNYAFHIVEKNKFLEELKSEMAAIKSKVKNEETVKSINKLGSKIYQNLMINKDREEFDIQVEQACEGFFNKLDEKYPSLTKQERRLSALLRIDLSSKDISGILNISPKSVDQTRYRLRKKLNLSKSKDLTTVFKNI